MIILIILIILTQYLLLECLLNSLFIKSGRYLDSWGCVRISNDLVSIGAEYGWNWSLYWKKWNAVISKDSKWSFSSRNCSLLHFFCFVWLKLLWLATYIKIKPFHVSMLKLAESVKMIIMSQKLLLGLFSSHYSFPGP